jgi:hypothetical protein
MALSPVPAEPPEASCANCGAQLVADQRYCLSCGQPVSPVRLAFLDVLQADPGAAAAAGAPWQHGPGAALAAYEPGADAGGAGAWARRNSGLLSLGAVLLLCLVVGLLVGHWTQGTSRGPQVVKIEGLSGLGAAAAAQPATAAPASSSSRSSAAKAREAKEEAQAAREAAKETKAEKAPPPAPVKVNSTKLKKLTQSTGKKHQEELNELGAQPIETG